MLNYNDLIQANNYHNISKPFPDWKFLASQVHRNFSAQFFYETITSLKFDQNSSSLFFNHMQLKKVEALAFFSHEVWKNYQRNKIAAIYFLRQLINSSSSSSSKQPRIQTYWTKKPDQLLEEPLEGKIFFCPGKS